MSESMDKVRVNVDDILNEIREIGFERFDQMKWIVLEPDGKISCIPYEGNHVHEGRGFIS